MGIYSGEKRMIVSSGSWRQTWVDNGAEEDRERDGSTSSSTTWSTCSSTWRMPRIELNGEGEPVWLTPHLKDPQPEGERERKKRTVQLFVGKPQSQSLEPRMSPAVRAYTVLPESQRKLTCLAASPKPFNTYCCNMGTAVKHPVPSGHSDAQG